jgi:hypothetical protein
MAEPWHLSNMVNVSRVSPESHAKARRRKADLRIAAIA